MNVRLNPRKWRRADSRPICQKQLQTGGRRINLTWTIETTDKTEEKNSECLSHTITIGQKYLEAKITVVSTAVTHHT